VQHKNIEQDKKWYTKFYKAIAVPVLTCGSKIWAITKKKQEAKSQPAEMKFLTAADYTRKHQIRNTKIREELNIFKLIINILKSRSQWNGRETTYEENCLTYNPVRRINIRLAQVVLRDQHIFQQAGTDQACPNP
jgi:hypothetical protein